MSNKIDFIKYFWENVKLGSQDVVINYSRRNSKTFISSLKNNEDIDKDTFYLEIAQYFYDKTREEGYLPGRKDFIKNAWQYIKSEQPELKSNISDKMKTKWNKRLYQLYDKLKKEFNISP